MSTNPHIGRFAVGKTYRLHAPSPKDSIPFRGGTMLVKEEVKPRDVWGNRVLLADVLLDPDKDGYGETRILSARCFVEEGYKEVVGSYGVRTVPVEIATIEGAFPAYGKAYATAEMPNAESGFRAMVVSRVA